MKTLTILALIVTSFISCNKNDSQQNPVQTAILTPKTLMSMTKTEYKFYGQRLKYFTVHSYYQEHFVRYDTTDGECVAFYTRTIARDTTKHHHVITYEFNLNSRFNNEFIWEKLYEIANRFDAVHGRELILIMRAKIIPDVIAIYAISYTDYIKYGEGKNLGTTVSVAFKERSEKYCQKYIVQNIQRYLTKELRAIVGDDSFCRIKVEDIIKLDDGKGYSLSSFNQIHITNNDSKIIARPYDVIYRPAPMPKKIDIPICKKEYLN